MIASPYKLTLSKACLTCLEPAPFISSWDWIKENLRTKDGVPFNHIDFPWCKGICDAWDDPSIRTIWLQFAARIGKSLISQALLMKSSTTDPAVAMIASSTRELIQETVREKIYPMFERSDGGTAALLPKKHRRLQTLIALRTFPWYCGWSGSPSTLGDKDPKYKWAYEIDKWTKQSSEEADPLALFNERGIEHADRKAIYESTPTIKGRSRVNRGLINGTNSRFLIPCPLCGEFSQLRRCTIKNKVFQREFGGLIWDIDKEGQTDPASAHKTARYLCPRCQKEWSDVERRPAIRRGVWCPEGCSVTQAGRLEGKPTNDGPDASFQLGRLYAPTFTFGDHARNWVQTDDKQNHVNSWDGEVYEYVAVELDWMELGDRLCLEDLHLGTCPMGANFLTAGVDVQADHWVYKIVAWGFKSSGWLIDYGICHSWVQVKEILRREYPHADGGPKLHIPLSLVDARDGNRTDEVIDFCRSVNKAGTWVFPSMGTSAKHMSGRPFSREDLDEKNRIKKRKSANNRWKGFNLIKVNTGYWQRWMDRCLYFRTPGTARAYALPIEAKRDQDLLEQMMNEVATDKEDTTGHETRDWVVKDESMPWDFRDCARYARCAAEVYVNNNWDRMPEQRVISRPDSAPAPPKGQPKQPQRPPALQAAKRSGFVRKRSWRR